MADWDLSEIQRQLLQLDPETRRALVLQSQDAAAAMMAASGQEQKLQERGPEIRSEASPAALRQQRRRERDVYWEENPPEPLNLEPSAPPTRKYAPGSGAVVGGFGNRPEGIFDVRGLNPLSDIKTLDLGMEPWLPAVEVGAIGQLGKQGLHSGLSRLRKGSPQPSPAGAPARVPQGGLETRGVPSKKFTEDLYRGLTERGRNRYWQKQRKDYYNERGALRRARLEQEAARRGASESAARVAPAKSEWVEIGPGGGRLGPGGVTVDEFLRSMGFKTSKK